jgi:hypothetical protein
MKVRTESEMPRVDTRPKPKQMDSAVELKKKEPVFASAVQQKEYEKKTGKKDAFSVKMKPQGRKPPQDSATASGGISAIQSGIVAKADPKVIGEFDIKKGQAMQAEAVELRTKADKIDEQVKTIRARPSGDGWDFSKLADAMEKQATGYRETADKLEAAGKRLEETGKQIIETGKLPWFNKILGQIQTVGGGGGGGGGGIGEPNAY